jgi:hypothetical protein
MPLNSYIMSQVGPLIQRRPLVLHDGEHIGLINPITGKESATYNNILI